MCPHMSPGLADCWGQEFENLYTKYENEGRFVRQVEARTLWNAIVESQVETGVPYMLYKDACNRKSNQQNLGTIKCSNLCTEIVEYTSPDEARRSNMRHRPIGIGVQGLADLFILMGLPFESEEAQLLNKQLFETLYFGALEASCELAEKNGPYETYEGSPVSKGILQYDMWGVTPTSLWDWAALKAKIARHGVRNSLLLAPMPTASTAQILGNNESFEPYTTNIYTRRVLSGEFQLTWVLSSAVTRSRRVIPSESLFNLSPCMSRGPKTEPMTLAKYWHKGGSREARTRNRYPRKFQLNFTKENQSTILFHAAKPRTRIDDSAEERSPATLHVDWQHENISEMLVCRAL
ncbi:unnamed protein product [Nesidiocoris tenuis]|uniref:Ribonucleotide reductase large subunit domain-containing protein n=1 Tax=Nesidiocoris tenuis TaxID=355587 RepID=A0A6H5GLU5_9HEMI|nr:unnamed protein product [Nesidiocoris tenuis]